MMLPFTPSSHHREIYTLENSPEVRQIFGTGMPVTPRVWLTYLTSQQHMPPPPPKEKLGVRGVVAARINYSRWLVDCWYCNASWYASKNFPALWCARCRMEHNDGQCQRIIFPDHIKEIEDALLMRPEPQNRNWLPGETVLDLWKENADHGIGGGYSH